MTPQARECLRRVARHECPAELGDELGALYRDELIVDRWSDELGSWQIEITDFGRIELAKWWCL